MRYEIVRIACASPLEAVRLVVLLHALARPGEEVSKLDDVVLYKKASA